MSNYDVSVSDIRARDVGFGAACLVSVALVVPVQIASMILFDSAGWDTFTPDVVFMGLLPAVAATLLPGAVAVRFYARRRALASIAGVVLVNVVVAIYLIKIYAVCGGPRC